MSAVSPLQLGADCSVGSCTPTAWALASLKSGSAAPVVFPGVPQARSTGQGKQGCSSQALSSPRGTPVISAFFWGTQLGQWFLQHMVPGPGVPLSHCPIVPLSHCPRVRELGLPTAELRVSRERRSKHEHPTDLILQSSNTMEPMDSIRMNHPGQIGSQTPSIF